MERLMPNRCPGEVKLVSLKWGHIWAVAVVDFLWHGKNYSDMTLDLNVISNVCSK